MSGTFAGGTPELIAMCRYIQAYPDATVPVNAGTFLVGFVQRGARGRDLPRPGRGGAASDISLNKNHLLTK